MQTRIIDCSYWAFLDKWKLIDGSLLLSGIDPNSLYIGFRKSIEDNFKEGGVINYIDGPVGIDQDVIKIVKRSYDVLKSMDLSLKYSKSVYFKRTYAADDAYHPYLIIYEAYVNGLYIFNQLKEVIERRFFSDTKENIFTINADYLTLSGQTAPKKEIRKEVKHNDCAMAFMAILVAKNSSKYRHGDNINASQIQAEILALAKELQISEDNQYGLKSIERDISSSLHHLRNASKIDLKPIISNKNSL